MSGRDNLPLSGIRVLDLATTLAGPTATRHMADYGAEVIKIESETHPDTIRVSTPYAGGQPGQNRSGYFGAYNAGKASFALNLRLPEAKDIMRRLIERSDVIIEAYVPGVMARLGYPWETVSSWNPRIIMLSHSLEGQTGPHSQHRGYGHIASAMSGWYDLTGYPGKEPVGPYSAYTDFVAWPYILIAVLTALELRDVTGVGQYIDHAQIESSLHFLTPLLLDLEANDRVAERQANHELNACPNNVYPCAGDDRWVAVTVQTDEEWRAFCEVLGHPEVAGDERFATHALRKANEEALDAMIDSWTPDLDALEVTSRLQAAGVPAGPVEDAGDLFSDPQLLHRRFFRRHPHAELGEHAIITNTFRLSGVEAGPFAAAPLLGEQTFDICRDVLELTDEELATYIGSGVFN